MKKQMLRRVKNNNKRYSQIINQNKCNLKTFQRSTKVHKIFQFNQITKTLKSLKSHLLVWVNDQKINPSLKTLTRVKVLNTKS